MPSHIEGPFSGVSPKPIKRSRKPPKAIKRGSKPSRVRKTASGALRSKLDAEWAKTVKASGKCAEIFPAHFCIQPLTAAHIISRRYKATRHDPKNGLPLCFASHRFYTEHPEAWKAFLFQVIGEEEYERLRRKALKGEK